MSRCYLCYVDGACSNNGRCNAQATGSFAVYDVTEELFASDDPHGDLHNSLPLMHESRFSITPRGRDRITNNYAEATSMLTLMTWLRYNRCLEPDCMVKVFCDSRIIINHLLGFYKCKTKPLMGIYQEIYRLMRGVEEKRIELQWISGDVMKASVIGH